MAQIKALFLDRDDTIIKNIPYMSKVSDIQYLPGVFSALKKAQDLDFKIFIVTNQSGLSRGYIKYTELVRIHETIKNDFLKEGVRIENFYISPYKHKHPRRKPGSDLIFEAQRDYNIDLSSSIMVGDGSRDVNAGLSAGIPKSILVNRPETFWHTMSFT